MYKQQSDVMAIEKFQSNQCSNEFLKTIYNKFLRLPASTTWFGRSFHGSTVLKLTCIFFLIFSLVGVVKGVLTTIIGFYTFGGVPVTALTLIGVVLNTLGGALYSYAKYSENMASGIQKHFHKHTIKVNHDAGDLAERKHHGLFGQNHNLQNGFVPEETVVTINDVDVEFGNSVSEDSSSDSGVG